ncbi:MAG: histidine phosphatase family protein [Bacteroidota bacterium]
MKSILFVRHAKSSWDNPAMKDFDRTLNDRGNKDAPMMAKRLLDKKPEIDLFVSSPAIRAFSTAKYFHAGLNGRKEQLVTIPELYHASVVDFYQIIHSLNNSFNTVAIFSHNPGITEMVNSLGVAKVDNMPTCAIFAVRADINNWNEFELSPKQFWFFDYPKLGS